MKKFLPIIAFCILLSGCGSKPADNPSSGADDIKNTNSEVTTVNENQNKYDPNDIFMGYGTDEEYAILEKTRAQSSNLIIDGKEFALPIDLEEFKEKMNIVEAEDDPNYQVARRTIMADADGNEFSFGYSINDPEVTAEFKIEENKTLKDVTFPLGMKLGYSKDDIIANIDPDLIVDKREAYNSQFVVVVNDTLISYTIIEIPFLDAHDGIVGIEYEKLDDMSLGPYITKNAYAKTHQEENTSGVFTLNGAHITFPMTLDDFNSNIASDSRPMTEADFDNFNFDDMKFQSFMIEYNYIATINGKEYRVITSSDPTGPIHLVKKPESVEQLATDEGPWMFMYTFKLGEGPYSLKNDKFEITEVDDIESIIKKLEDASFVYRADNMFGNKPVEVEFYLDDYTHVKINKERVDVDGARKDLRNSNESQWEKQKLMYN